MDLWFTGRCPLPKANTSGDVGSPPSSLAVSLSFIKDLLILMIFII
ncbi:hypothetical protein AB46_0596 [Escherichia coli 3-267-03_S1_C2]|jgi:hypothetical protein|nr:hypothetical protein AB46_0596 [Escherichia coli 3-267-03_S1_C2]